MMFQGRVALQEEMVVMRSKVWSQCKRSWRESWRKRGPRGVH